MSDDPKCVAGCVSFYGGEKKHHKDCPHYPESLTKATADRIEKLEAKLAQQDDLVQAANRLAEYLNGDHIYMERVHHLAAAIRKGGE